MWWFPHYTWGYIGQAYRASHNDRVPSLYVRVYRTNLPPGGVCDGSLTIREGISLFNLLLQFCVLFPHYTWGYIIIHAMGVSRSSVPSLYVRVYRPDCCTIRRNLRSLTIREGISKLSCVLLILDLFPHYTWGYIVDARTNPAGAAVPSLYVRVYRKPQL